MNHPTTLTLPDGFRPEGIAIDDRYAYFGSMGTGSIFRVDLADGTGAHLTRTADAAALGLKIDRHGRLFVAGGGGGDARVLDTRTGALLASYRFATEATFVNDVVLAPDGAWFTDSTTPVLHKIPRTADDTLPAHHETLPLSGDIRFRPGTNSNGIETTPDLRALIVAQHNTGVLFRVDPTTGRTAEIPITGGPLSNTDGILRAGTTLYVAENRDDRVAVVTLDPTGSRATLVARVTDPRFDVPTTIARHRDRLYLPNGRFTTTPTPTTTYTAVAIPLP
ncbi:superoxide dismutase [Actinosynnema sp. NPDC020468]|uniref:SMP-30/gluconolactonase/LRE family protein n=1 Tax=Actinosynnema sp. NPDC020468 TaxID=3154488 RepID=UPI0033EF5574